MKLGLLGVFCALLFHAGVLLFGGLIFGTGRDDLETLQEVELLAEATQVPEEKKPEEPSSEHEDELEAEAEEVPDASELLRSLELAPLGEPPALDAASLSAIEQALSGQGGGGDFADAVSFTSGGRIGSLGKAGGPAAELESAFSLTEIDQKPRALYQASPLYPSELRSKKLEGVAAILFVVDATGKVTNARVDKATHPAFERPALEAVRQWKFEPALKAGQRVGCKMRVSIRFQPSTR